MTLLSPWWLLALIPIVALVVGYVVAQRRRRRYAVRFATLPMLARVAPRSPGWRRHLPAGLLVAALVAFTVAAARPEVELRVPHERATVIVAIDVSRSMEATDVQPTRLDAARDAAASFIEDLPDTFQVGVVTFSGVATVLAPPTTDHADVVRRLQSLNLANATAIGEAVFTSLDQIAAVARSSEEPGSGQPTPTPGPTGEPGDPDEPAQVPARIVLLSDGTNTRGREVPEAADAAAAAEVPVSTIAYGTPNGVIDIGMGRLVAVPVDEMTLRQLAEATGGQAYRAGSGQELASVYEDIGSSIGWRTEPREVGGYVTGAALLLALVAAALSLRWFARLP
ncbi:Ca-activated chloride channel family protein [Kineosphaera limosa]|uniref:VWFA domain-containing protein n=1 Tax=Kineosphaera limosa NBRC 100340 TaxID=1184609 RepID=K6VP09_9MICO|nr:VWA domain-containing protein [Kineosphaera limosa]NYE01874.1 Ca-activated chloride channel family protein [Kineosphaera limosa]GAB97943.1 hypothetical protein KILIM_089_00130 [Kineosphaera limosa NBRC 100340]